MTLKLIPIRTLQIQLDERIMNNHGVTRPETRMKRILALMVEIGELANETRSFKFWSFKKASEKDVLLEELGDCVHFTISLGIDLNDTSETLDFIPKSASLSEQFIDWMSECAKLKTEFTLVQYKIVLAYIGSVALAMGFEAKDVYEFYLKKNEINHSRQDKQY
jgi:dimeric dUTPase (all-alpha-NTP-PPase superfamily)